MSTCSASREHCRLFTEVRQRCAYCCHVVVPDKHEHSPQSVDCMQTCCAQYPYAFPRSGLRFSNLDL